jgi:hypothetical protein
VSRRIDGEHATSFVPAEHQEPQGADAVCLHEPRPPVAQERTTAVTADLHCNHPAEMGMNKSINSTHMLLLSAM